MERDVERDVDDRDDRDDAVDVDGDDGDDSAVDATVPDRLDKTLADSFPASDPPAQP